MSISEFSSEVYRYIRIYSYITIAAVNKLFASKGRRPFGGERADKRPVGLLEVKDLEKSRKMSL